MQITRSNDLPEGFVALAKVTGVFGIRGELRVFLFNPQSRLLNTWKTAYLWDGQNPPRSIRVKTRSGAGKKIIAAIEDIKNPEDARALREQLILFEKSKLPKSTDDEWYHHELIGMAVHTESGEHLGEVVEIVPGQVDILVAEGQGVVIHIPNTQEDVLTISIEGGIIVPDEDEGGVEASESDAD